MYTTENVPFLSSVPYKMGRHMNLSGDNMDLSSSYSPNVLRCNINLEDFTVIWVDCSIDKSDDCLDTLKHFRTVVNYIKTFDNIDDCMNYIIECATEKLFLITSGQFSLEIISKVHSLSQIEYIYVFCFNEQKYQQLAIDYKKIHGIFIDRHNLITKLKEDIINSTANKNFIENTIRNINDDRPSIVWFDILVSVLIRMSDVDDNKAKKDMIEQCRSYYSENQSQLDIIDQFEKEYAPDQAIKWYTRDALIYRLLNRAFRTENIDIIYVFRFFVKDLYEQLQKLHKEFVKVMEECDIDTIKLYRGQAMKLDELEKIKSNSADFVYLNTFLSTTMDKQVAKIYADVKQNEPELVPVFFEIDINIDTLEKPFADIRRYSYMKDESETLLSPGTQFRIVSIEEISNTWHIYLTTITDFQENNSSSYDQLRQFQYYLANSIAPVTTMQTFIHCLYIMGDDIKSNQYKLLWKAQEISRIEELEQNIHTIGTDIDALLEFYQYIGSRYFQVDDFKSALNYFEKVMELIENDESLQAFDEYDQIDMFYQMGASYFRSNNYQVSIKYFQEALKIYFKSASDDNTVLKNLLSYLSYAYFAVENYDEALKSAKMALNIFLEHFSKNVLDISFEYEFIGAIYAKLGHYQEAFDNLEKALQLSNILPANNHFLIDTYYSISSVCRKLNKNDQAMFYAEKANELLSHSKYLKNVQAQTNLINENMLIFKRKRAKYDDRIKYTLENMIDIALLHENEGNNRKSIEYFHNAFDLIKDDLTSNDTRTTAVSILNHLGDMYQLIGRVDEAIVQYLKALDLCPLENYKEIAYSSIGIGNIYFNELCNNEQSLRFYEKALEMKLKYMNETATEIVDLYDAIGGVYLDSMKNEDNNIHEGQIALKYFHHIQQIYYQTQMPHDRLISDVHIEIGDVYRYMKEYDRAIFHYQQAIDIALTLDDDEEKSRLILKQLYIDIGSLHYILFKQTEEMLNYRNAVSYLEQATQMKANFTLEEDPQFILVFKMLGDLNYYTNNDLAAIHYYEVAVSCEKKAQRPFDESYMKEIFDLYLYAGLLFHRFDNIDLAFQFWNRATQFMTDYSACSSVHKILQMIFDKVSHLHALKYKEEVTFL